MFLNLFTLILHLLFEVLTFFFITRGLAPYSHCSSTPLPGAAPLATYARQVLFVPCEYWTDPNTLCLYERSREKIRAANIYLGTFTAAQISPNGLRYRRLVHRI